MFFGCFFSPQAPNQPKKKIGRADFAKREPAGCFLLTSWRLSIGVFVDVIGKFEGGALHVGLRSLGVTKRDRRCVFQCVCFLVGGEVGPSMVFLKYGWRCGEVFLKYLL